MTGNSGGNARDNRQRGNAAQLLEKYKSMARDAQLAGDRVQTEYFLQFADHYFRVLDDGRARFDEQRRQRGDDDGHDDDADDDRLDNDNQDDGSDDGDSEEQPQRRPARAASDRPNDRPNDRPSDRSGPRRDRPNGRAQGEDGRGRGPARDDDGDNRVVNDRGGNDRGGDERIDYAVLPPAIRADDTGSADRSNDDEDAPKPRRRARRPRAEEAGTDDAPAS